MNIERPFGGDWPKPSLNEATKASRKHRTDAHPSREPRKWGDDVSRRSITVRSDLSFATWYRMVTTPGQRTFTGFAPGKLYHYGYRPKYADSLPFFDVKPLVVFVRPDDGGRTFLGFNIHYIPRAMREELFAEFDDRQGDAATVKLETWRKLGVLSRYYPFMVRKYLFKNILGRVYVVPPGIISAENVRRFETEKFYKLTSDQIFALAEAHARRKS